MSVFRAFEQSGRYPKQSIYPFRDIRCDHIPQHQKKDGLNMNAYVEFLFEKHLSSVLNSNTIPIPDTQEEMNWHAFFAHSQDMQGFRADLFTEGHVDANGKRFIGLRDQWSGDSTSLIDQLGGLWDNQAIREELIKASNPFKSADSGYAGTEATLDILRNSGVNGAKVFADVLSQFTGDRIARKTNRMIRAYIQNAHLLNQHNSSFRCYLQDLLPDKNFPPDNISSAEKTWSGAIERDFYNVGPALASYMISDWLLWLWLTGKIEWFESYKADSVHNAIVEHKIVKPAEDFVTYCKNLKIPESGGSSGGKACPPRVLNECIWLEENKSSKGKKPAC